MKLKNRTITALASSALATTLVIGLGGFGLTSASASASPKLKHGQTFYLIPKDTVNPYETLEDGGITAALKTLGDKTVVNSGTTDTAASQIPGIQAAIQAHAAGIVIAGNDPSALCPSLAQAHAAGLAIVSADSDISCPNHLFINQAVTSTIGSSEVDLLAKEIGGSGQIAILSAAATATNQNSWIKYMKLELKKYPKMKLVATVYGNDQPAASLTVLQGLLSAYPNLRGIISPTTVGISTAAQYLDTHKSLLKHLTLTGLGLPSQMKKYVLDGTVKSFELWNPVNLGRLAGFAVANLASGTIKIAAGQKFNAPGLGEYTILPAAAGTGPSVVLGPPFVFTKANVAKFNF